MAITRIADIYNRHGICGLIEILQRRIIKRHKNRIPWPEYTLRPYLLYLNYIRDYEFSGHDPFAIHWIDPNEIIYCSRNSRPVIWGTVCDGQIKGNRFADRPISITLRQHYSEEIPWEETELFSAFKLKMEQGGGWGHNSPNEFNRRIADIERVVDSIRTDGYKTQRELGQTSRAKNNEPIPPLFNEITIDIGPDGGYLWRDFGQHRLAIAQQFNIDEVPVIIATRHKQYLDKIT